MYIQPKKQFKNQIIGILEEIVSFYWPCIDLEFVKKFTWPNFQVKEFYTLKTRKLRLFSLVINSNNASYQNRYVYWNIDLEANRPWNTDHL